MQAKTLKRLSLSAKIVVTLVLLAVSLYLMRLENLTGALRQAEFGWLAVSALLLVAGGFAGACSWFCILRAGMPALSFREAAACHWSGMFFNSFLPSNVGGDVVKGYIAARGQGRAGFVVVSILVDRAVNLGMLILIGLFALLLQKGRPGGAAALVAAVLALALLATAVARRAGRRAGRLAELAEPVLELAARPRLFAATLLAALASQLLKTGHNAFIVLALGLKIPALALWYVIPLFGIVSALPVSIGGLGVREMVARGISGPLQIDGTQLVALSLGGYLMVVLVNMLGALPFLFARRRSAR